MKKKEIMEKKVKEAFTFKQKLSDSRKTKSVTLEIASS